MESIIKVVEGKQFGDGKCFFCKSSTTKIFGIIDVSEDRYNGSKFKGFHICDKHLDALNTLLNGKNNIEDLMNTFIMTSSGKINFNLRT